MKIVERGDATPIRRERYSGAVELETMRVSPSPADADVLRVHYGPASVTNWHSHPGGQFLYILSEGATVGTEGDGAVHLEQGTLVIVPPGERHWHGSTNSREATFLAVTWGVTRWEDLSAATRTS